jgi:hypothetical protein
MQKDAAVALFQHLSAVNEKIAPNLMQNSRFMQEI